MKDKIREKMNTHIKYLLRKEVLTKEDYDTLAAALGKIEFDEGKEERDAQYKNLMLGAMGIGFNSAK